MLYQVTHKTEYEYTFPVRHCQNIAMLRPRDTPYQKCISSKLNVVPEIDCKEEYKDFFGNHVTYFAIEHEHYKLSVISELLLENDYSHQSSIPLFDSLPWQMSLLESEMQTADIRQYAFPTPITAASQEIKDYALASFPQERPLYEGVLNLMHRIFHDFEFKSGYTTIATPPSEVIRLRKGVCQDFAHLSLACLRSLKIPSRYVSGYIETLPPPGKKKLQGTDASHAWFAVYIPGAGWMDFDPTNDQIPHGQHLTIGWGRDYFDIVPLKGVILGSGEHELNVSVDVNRLK